MEDAFPVRANCPEVVDHHARAVGGTTAVTVVTGTSAGLTWSWVSTGRYRMTWTENPGTFVNATVLFQATTPADVKSFVAVLGAYDATNFRLDIYAYESGSLADLAALEWLNVTASFRRGALD